MFSLRLAHIVALCTVIWIMAASPVMAHPADEIIERDFVHVHADGIEIETVISAGVIKLYKVWEDADTDHDGQLSPTEREQFGPFLAGGYDLTLDGAAVAAAYVPGSLTMATSREEFARQGAGPEGAVVTAIFRLPLDATRAHVLLGTINHYSAYASGSDGTPRPPEVYPDTAPGVGVTSQGPSADHDLRLTITPPGTTIIPQSPTAAVTSVSAERTMPPPRSPNTARTAWLTDLLRTPARGTGYAVLGMIVATALGALHALTPGHGKTMVAAYLVGGRGRVRDAFVLGGAVTLTHTGSVILLGVITLLFARFALPERVIPWLEALSGLGILVLGSSLLGRRVRALPPRGPKIAAQPALAHARHATEATARGSTLPSGWHSHADGTEHAHGSFGTHTHGDTTSERLSLRALVLMGMSGGLVPCPDALAILLVAVAVGRIWLGLAVILCFSLGLAAVLIGLGVIIAGSRALERGPLRRAGSSRWARIIPPVSAAVVVLIGLVSVAQAVLGIAAMR